MARGKEVTEAGAGTRQTTLQHMQTGNRENINQNLAIKPQNLPPARLHLLNVL